MPGKTVDSLCADCETVEAVLEIRKRLLCRDCFSKYANSKVLKRMESYRFKNSQNDPRRKLLLPVSGGVSSMALLQILDAQLQRQQASRNRTAYDLVVGHVDLSLEDNTRLPAWYEALQERFVLHQFLPVLPLSEVIASDSRLEMDLAQLNIHLMTNGSPSMQLSHILGSAKSVTAKTDLQNMLMLRLLVALARRNDCEAILWGHSDSRLAAKALAGVAKGRGGSLPSEICDGATPWGLNFNYPARDLFKSELMTYTSQLPDSFEELIVEGGTSRPMASIRHTSIDDLLTEYISSQGEKYPSIMANVVRTVSKLQSPDARNGPFICSVCRAPTVEGAGDATSRLCYACARTKEDVTATKPTI